MIAERATSEVALKIIQAPLNLGVAFWSSPFLADVKSRDVPDSWLLFGRVKIMVGDAADVPFETFHGFVVIVGGSWPCGTELETHAQEGLSSGGN